MVGTAAAVVAVAAAVVAAVVAVVVVAVGLRPGDAAPDCRATRQRRQPETRRQSEE